MENNCIKQKISHNNDEDIVQTVILPVSAKTVVINAGYGVPDERVRLLH